MNSPDSQPDLNMRILAIDTALSACSVAVTQGRRLLAQAVADIGRGHAELLPTMVQAAMGQAGLSFADLDRLAVTVGPGSFTGLRVGLAYARGIAQAGGTPLIGVETLTALAAGAVAAAATGDAARPILAAIDARQGAVHAQRFDVAGRALAPPALVLIEDLAAMPGAWTIVGDAAARLAALAPERFAAADLPTYPDAYEIARLALMAPAPAAGDYPVPLYVRPAQVTMPHGR